MAPIAELFGEVRSVLHGAPSPEGWARVCRVLDRSPEGAVELIQFVQELAATWPDEVRELPSSWFDVPQDHPVEVCRALSCWTGTAWACDSGSGGDVGITVFRWFGRGRVSSAPIVCDDQLALHELHWMEGEQEHLTSGSYRFDGRELRCVLHDYYEGITYAVRLGPPAELLAARGGSVQIRDRRGDVEAVLGELP